MSQQEVRADFTEDRERANRETQESEEHESHLCSESGVFIEDESLV